MRLHRLFNVLVVMCGAPLLAAGCATDDGQQRDELNDGPDAAPGADGAGAGEADAAPAGEGDPCFCDVQVCCDRSTQPAQLMPGFECCWSTTCP